MATAKSSPIKNNEIKVFGITHTAQDIFLNYIQGAVTP